MDFQTALTELENGKRLSRYSWHIGRFIFLVPGSTFKVNRAPLMGIFEEGTEIKYLPHIDVFYGNSTVGVWVPTNDDILGKDWYIEET